MKKLVLIFGIMIAFASCSKDPKCIPFNKENYLEAFISTENNDLFTYTERRLLEIYFFQYISVHMDTLYEMPEDDKQIILESGFKDHDNMCDVIDNMRQQAEKAGMTEEEFIKRNEWKF